ncbi:hypothetical protein ACVWW2_002815 [Bradyrhizobium sp. LM4.3]
MLETRILKICAIGPCPPIAWRLYVRRPVRRLRADHCDHRFHNRDQGLQPGGRAAPPAELARRDVLRAAASAAAATDARAADAGRSARSNLRSAAAACARRRGAAPSRHGGCFTVSARSEHRGRRAAAAACTRARLRGTARHALGGVDRRPRACARRLLHGALFDRGRPGRPRRARVPWRRVRAGAAWRRRMVAAQGEHLQHRRAADRQHSRDPHRGRHGGGVCDHLRCLRALWLPGARDRFRAARPCRARHAGRSALARACARGPRRGRRVRDADPRLQRQAGLLGGSTSISLSSPPRASVSRVSGCGAGLQSRQSPSPCSGSSRVSAPANCRSRRTLST